MTTIRLLDARHELNLKCRELFRDEKIADAIYRYLCDGIEECKDAEPERKTGKWVCDTCSKCGKNLWDYFHYSEDGAIIEEPNFCPNCGADMRIAKHGTKIDLCIMDEVEGRT